jgi:membrane-bound lytic murein transglycosylase D
MGTVTYFDLNQPLLRSRTTGLVALMCIGTLAACSSTPKKADAEPKAATEQAATSPIAAPLVRDPVVDAATNQALAEPSPAEPKNAEEAVASAVAEQDLLTRLRAGFVMNDATNVIIDREVAWFARNPDYLDRSFRRAERYLFFIVEELEARKMPMELALLPIVESAFNPVALSNARAAGLWQFIPSTGKRYGLEQNQQYDGRRDIVESTRAALDYLQWLANEFNGDWQQAVAAYNSGEMNVTRAIARNVAKGKSTDFFSLDLPRETRAYVPKLLALRRIVSEPAKYGLEFGDMANQPFFAKVELGGPIDLGVAAQLAGLPKDELLALNPAYNRAVTNADGPGHLLVPIDHAEQLRAGLAALLPAQRVPKIYYTVHRGDTVASVARKLGVTPAELTAGNRIASATLRVGQELVIDRSATQRVATQTNSSRKANDRNANALRIAATEPLAGPRVVTRDPSYVPPPLPPISRADTQAGMHTVRSGETLSSIARKYGVTANALANENKLNTKQHLTKGRKLWIPQADDVTPVASKPVTAPVTSTVASVASSSTTVSSSMQRVSYIVRAGDTLTRIAKMFSVEISQLLAWNKLHSANALVAGQKLVMYVEGSHPGG